MAPQVSGSILRCTYDMSICMRPVAWLAWVLTLYFRMQPQADSLVAVLLLMMCRRCGNVQLRRAVRWWWCQPRLSLS
jgi:hypothetical protein